MNTLKLVLKNKTLMKKIGFTLLAFLIYRLAIFIPVPMVTVPDALFNTELLGFLNSFTGGALQNLSIVALGVSPYITASIVTQVLQMDIVPALKEWGEQGEVGQRKISRLNRYLSVALAFVQALAMTIGMRYLGVGVESNLFTFTYLAIVMTAGSCFLVWLGDQITLRGVGNGVSMIIACGIISGFPQMFTDLYAQFIAKDPTAATIAIFAFVVVLMILVVLGTTFMQAITRKIPVQYANRANNVRGKNDSNIPIRLNAAGVMPVIFAITILSLPLTVIAFTGVNNGLTYWLNQIFSQSEPIGMLLYIFLIFVFTFYYSFITVNPEKISENLSKQNSYVPGIRPGEDTEVYISKVLFKVTMLGALYLSVLALLPILSKIIFSLPASVTIGGTSILIVVGVAVETFRQIETEAKKVEYKGFIK